MANCSASSDVIPLVIIIHMVIPMLKCDKLSSFIDGSSTAPLPPLRTLILQIPLTPISEVVGLTAACEVCLALEAAFVPSSSSHAQQLHDELQFLRRGIN
ncbi:hypothetical protein ACS0TY_017591 [Phlomoides rotata]